MGLIAILLMAFLFFGEPDLWDNLHDYAMKATSTKEECKK
jgi:hypothetical protein